MNFLRSIIHDARSHKPGQESGNKSPASGYNTLESYGAVPRYVDQSLSAGNYESPLSRSSSNPDNIGEIKFSENSAVQEKNTENHGIQNITGDIEPGYSPSETLDSSGFIFHEPNTLPPSTGDMKNPEQESEEKESGIKDNMAQQQSGMAILDKNVNSLEKQNSNFSAELPETPTDQNQGFSPEETALPPYPPDIGKTPDKISNDIRGESSYLPSESAGRESIRETMSPITEDEESSSDKTAVVSVIDNQRNSEITEIEQAVGKRKLSENKYNPDMADNRLSDRSKFHEVTHGIIKQVIMEELLDYPKTSIVNKPGASGAPIREAETKDFPSAVSSGTETVTSLNYTQNTAHSQKHPVSEKSPSSISALPLRKDLINRDKSFFHSDVGYRPPLKTRDTPKVQIGQIDIIIETTAKPPAASKPSKPVIDLSSRYYLRSL